MAKSFTSRALTISAVLAMFWAVTALALGIITDSQMVIFDGLYSFISVLLTGVSIVAYRLMRKGPSARYPYGRPGLEPIAILVKASALAALCLYALAGAAGDLLDGGHEVSTGVALVYASVSTVICGIVAWYMRKRSANDQLVKAEASQWLMDALLSAGVTVGFVIAVVLAANGQDELARLVDPAMVTVASLAFLPVPARLFRRAWRELLGSAPEDVDQELRAQVTNIAHQHGFTDTAVRVIKTGPQLDVMVTFQVAEDDDPVAVGTLDAIRTQLDESLQSTGLKVWLDVAVTANPRWVV